MRLLFLIVLAIPLTQANAQLVTRYRVESNTKTVIDMSAIAASLGGGADMPPTQEKTVTTVALVTVTTRDTTGGKIVHIVVDSITSNAAAGIGDLGELPPELSGMMRGGKGGTFDLVSIGGKQSGLRMVPEMSLELSQLGSMVTLLFPPVKAGTRVGDVWSDTLAVDSAMSVMGVTANLKSRTAMSWKMAGPDSITATLSGTTSMAISGQATMAGTSTGTQILLFDASRAVREATSTIAGTSTVSMGGTGEMGTKTTQTFQVKRIP